MPTYQRDTASIYFEDHGGDDFPLLLIAPGGMNSAIPFWDRIPIDPIEAFRDDFRVIAMDQRNCGQSHGALDPEDPWTSYVEDQLGLLDHLGVDRYVAIGCCIGSSYLLKHAIMQPKRMVAAVLQQPIGLTETNTEIFQDKIWKSWGAELVAGRDDLTMEQLNAFGAAMWDRDFIFSIPKERISSIRTPMLVMAGTDAAHPPEVSEELAMLLPNGELVADWKRPAMVPQSIATIRRYLKAQVEASA